MTFIFLPLGGNRGIISFNNTLRKGLCLMKRITPDTHFGMKLASWAVLILFIATTFISVGAILREQAQAGTRLEKVESKIDAITSKISDDIATVKEDVAEIKGMLKARQ